jgi:E3 ubiquitin-protein ligase HUWE1
MLVTPGFNHRQKEAEEEEVLPTLSEQLTLDRLWETLSSCLLELADTPDHHAVLVLQVCD